MVALFSTYDALADLEGQYANNDGAQQAHAEWMAMSDEERDLAMDAAELEYESMRDSEMEQQFAEEGDRDREYQAACWHSGEMDDVPF